MKDACTHLKTITGIVVKGHQVASRKSEHYPRGTIEMQTPYFKELGLDLSRSYQGTLNISIAPARIKVKKPAYIFREVKWTTAHPAEDFSFSECEVKYRGEKYAGWVYYPHPETKERHFQNPSIIEVIASLIAGIKYGDEVEITVNSDEIAIEEER
jgi:hypothetical protein